jgi:hypothetical protein
VVRLRGVVSAERYKTGGTVSAHPCAGFCSRLNDFIWRTCMNISFSEDEQNVYFRVANFPQEYENVLKGSYFTFDEKGCYKKFDKLIDNIEQVKVNFASNAEEMFAQQGYFKPVLWEDALLSFIEKVKNKNIDWWLTGSCATCVRGINIEPHDVDIMLNSKDIEKINDIFRDYIVEPIIGSKGWVVDYFGVLFMSARIDIAFDPAEWVDSQGKADFGPYASNHLEEIVWKGNIIKVPPIELQLDANKNRQRFDRVRVIEDFLMNR